MLYLHGFNSGSGSPKARLVQAACRRLGVACLAPQLPHRPGESHALAEGLLASLGPRPLVIGSSMGGFLVTCLAERHGLRAVTINPAVRPARLVEGWLGQSFFNAYTGERFTVSDEHRDELAAMTPTRLDPGRYLVLLGTADEVLACGDAFDAYRGASMILHPRGDHGFGVLADYLPAILAHGGHRLQPEQVAACLEDA